MQLEVPNEATAVALEGDAEAAATEALGSEMSRPLPAREAAVPGVA